MKPALTINEPTVTGALRAELYGNAELAKAHLHEARTVLGTMRSIYGVNERIAQGEGGGFYHQWATLKDGTKVHAISNDGQDTIRIYSPPPPQSEEPVKKPEEEDKRSVFAVCGWYTDLHMPWVWKENAGYSFPTFGDYYTGQASGVSWNGDRACGYLGGDDLEQGFLWSRQEGMTMLGESFEAFRRPTCISGDGHMIGCDNAEVWTLQEGFRQLTLQPGPNLANGAGGVNCLSPEGRLAGGYLTVPTGLGGATRNPAIWSTVTGGYELLPLDGSYEVVSQSSLRVTEMQAILGVFSQLSIFHPGVWDDSGFHEPYVHVFNADGSERIDTLPGSLYTDILPGYPITSSVEATASGTDGAGVTTEEVTREIEWHVPNGGEVLAMTYTGKVAVGYVGEGPQAAIWRNGALTVLGHLPGRDNSAATGVSMDGKVVVGRSRNATDGSSWFIWTEDTGMVELGVGTGNAISQGAAWAVGFSGAFSFTDAVAMGRTRPDPTDGSYQQMTFEDGLGTVISEALSVTKLTILHNADGSTTFEPPMPGLTIQI